MRVKANQESTLFKKGKGEMSWISWGMVEMVPGKVLQGFLPGRWPLIAAPASRKPLL